MNSTAVVTIVSNNYLHFARTLMQSVAQQQTVSVTGWNKDIIIGKTEAAPHFFNPGLVGGELFEAAIADGIRGV